jgi:hypothetical protein
VLQESVHKPADLSSSMDTAIKLLTLAVLWTLFNMMYLSDCHLLLLD